MIDISNGTKKCKSGGHVKPLAEFYRRKNGYYNLSILM